jgi:hypothetical protein
LSVFGELRSAQESVGDEALSEAVAYLRRVYHWRTYAIGRSFRPEGSLDDEVSVAWIRFILHCLTAKEPYRSFRHLVKYHVMGAFSDDWKSCSAVKRNKGQQPLGYDESLEGEPVAGVVPAVEAPSLDISSEEVFEAVDALVASGEITGQQRAIFLSYVYEGLSTEELMNVYKIAKASVFRHINHVGRLLRRFL